MRIQICNDAVSPAPLEKYIYGKKVFLMLEFSIATISVFVATLNELTKYITKTYIKKDISRYIPLFSLLYGLILGISGFFIPSVEMGSNIVEAIFIGLSAGAASTGIHQVYKQQTKTNTSIEENTNENE